MYKGIIQGVQSQSHLKGTKVKKVYKILTGKTTRSIHPIKQSLKKNIFQVSHSLFISLKTEEVPFPQNYVNYFIPCMYEFSIPAWVKEEAQHNTPSPSTSPSHKKKRYEWWYAASWIM